MARKSRRANIVQEKKEELHISTPIITKRQLATATYARLSVDKEKNEESIQNQIELLHQYIKEHEEYSLIDTYVDDGYTGTDFDRPEFIRLMDDVRTGKIQCIIVKDLSRFGRNFIETGYYIETIFPCLNVRLISINDDFDSSREEDRNSMVVPIKNMINEMYAKDASKKRVLSFEMHSFPQKVKCMECGTTMTYMRYTNFGQSQGIRKGFYYCKEYDGKPGYCRQKAHEDLLKITVMDQIHNMIKVMCDKKVLLEKMREGTYDKGELVSLRVKIQNMQYRLAKAEETSATLYENFATGLLDEQEYLTLKEHYVQEKEKLEDGINQAQARKRMVEKSIDDFLEIEKNLEQYLDDRSFNQKLIDELVDKIYVSSKGMIEVRMKCSDVFQKVMEIME